MDSGCLCKLRSSWPSLSSSSTWLVCILWISGVNGLWLCLLITIHFLPATWHHLAKAGGENIWKARKGGPGKISESHRLGDWGRMMKRPVMVRRRKGSDQEDHQGQIGKEGRRKQDHGLHLSLSFISWPHCAVMISYRSSLIQQPGRKWADKWMCQINHQF